MKSFYYIYLFLSICGSGCLVWLNGTTHPLAIVGLFVLYFVLLYLLLFLLHILVFGIAGMTIPKGEPPKDIHNFYRWYGFASSLLFMKTLHIHVHMHGLERMPEKGTPFLMVSNHRSIFDPVVQLIYFEPWDLAFISKQENLKIPFVGRYIDAIGSLPLDRENAKNAVKSIKKAAENIRNGYANYGIYPEGWENKTHDPLLPFRNGAFKIAKDAKCAIVPVAVRNSDKIFRRALLFRRIHIHVDVLETIPADIVTEENTSQLSERAFKILGDFLTEHPADVYLSAKG